MTSREDGFTKYLRQSLIESNKKAQDLEAQVKGLLAERDERLTRVEKLKADNPSDDTIDDRAPITPTEISSHFPNLCRRIKGYCTKVSATIPEEKAPLFDACLMHMMECAWIEGAPPRFDDVKGLGKLRKDLIWSLVCSMLFRDFDVFRFKLDLETKKKEGVLVVDKNRQRRECGLRFNAIMDRTPFNVMIQDEEFRLLCEEFPTRIGARFTECLDPYQRRLIFDNDILHQMLKEYWAFCWMCCGCPQRTQLVRAQAGTKFEKEIFESPNLDDDDDEDDEQPKANKQNFVSFQLCPGLQLGYTLMKPQVRTVSTTDREAIIRTNMLARAYDKKK